MVFPVIVQDGDKDINQFMLDKGFAERKLHKQVCLLRVLLGARFRLSFYNVV